jgi:hypothetical protein
MSEPLVDNINLKLFYTTKQQILIVKICCFVFTVEKINIFIEYIYIVYLYAFEVNKKLL